MKNKLRVVIVLAIVFAVYTVLTFALPFEKNAVLWVSYIFGAAAIAAQLYVLHTAFAKGESARSKFYGFPIAKIGVAYLLVQLALGLVFMVLAKLVPLWLPLVLYVVLLGAAVIGFIAADTMRDEVERQDTKLKTDTSTMRTLQTRAAALAASQDSGEVKAQIQTLADNLRYSDPISADATRETESKLTACMDELEQSSSDEDATAIIRRMNALLAERNQLCKSNKN